MFWNRTTINLQLESSGMDYETVQPPFSLDFHNMDRQEANNYYAWFLNQIPLRMNIIQRAINSTKGYEERNLNNSPESLVWLGNWLFEQVEVRERTDAERNAIYSDSPEWFKGVEIDDWELTNRTFSLTFDIGMYFGTMFLNNHQELKWTLVTKPKNYVHYHQPVIAGSVDRELNPVHIMTTCAYSFASKNSGPGRIRELYDIWRKILVET